MHSRPSTTPIPVTIPADGAWSSYISHAASGESSGRVFAYCFARVGSRNVAEWAVNATFDRARAALANGGMNEPELDWLLRTADKFCAPKLCLDARPLESMLVLQDWQGKTFDEI